MIHPLSLNSIDGILGGGVVGKSFAAHMRRVVADMEDRPADDSAREVTIKFSAKPVMDEHGTLDEVRAQFHITSSVPKHKTKPYSFAVRGKQLVFNDMSDDDVHQHTIDE